MEDYSLVANSHQLKVIGNCPKIPRMVENSNLAAENGLCEVVEVTLKDFPDTPYWISLSQRGTTTKTGDSIKKENCPNKQLGPPQ